MRIVAGLHRGRNIESPKDLEVRPTSDRLRESLFSVLAHREDAPLEDAIVLDAFCGTGALGLEALSRGAARAVFMDCSGDSLALAKRNIAALKEDARSIAIRTDAARHPPRAKIACTLVFLDPPYGKGLAAKALAALAEAGWFVPRALCVVEMDPVRPEVFPEGFVVEDTRRWGQSEVAFLRAP